MRVKNNCVNAGVCGFLRSPLVIFGFLEEIENAFKIYLDSLGGRPLP